MEAPKTKLQPKSQTKTPKLATETQTLGDHIAELRRRLFYVGLVFLIGSILAYSYRQELMNVILSPLAGQKLVYLTPGGGFSFIFQVSIYAGLISAAPVMVYQLHAFIRPALPDRAQKSVKRITLLATILIIGGISYGYFVAIPNAIHFLSTFAEGFVTPNLTADSYLSFFLAYIGGLALLSLVPLVIIFWHWINPLTPGGVLKGEQWIILGAFILAAIITPTPDVLNQSMIAGPVIAVYQIGVIYVLTSIKRAKRQAKRAKKRAAAAQPLFVTHKPPVVRPVVLNSPTPSQPVQTFTPKPIPNPTNPVSIQTERFIDGVSVAQRPSRIIVHPRPETSYISQRPQPVSRHVRHRLSVDGMIPQ